MCVCMLKKIDTTVVSLAEPETIYTQPLAMHENLESKMRKLKGCANDDPASCFNHFPTRHDEMYTAMR